MEYTIQTTTKRVFTHEYRAEAVKLVTEQSIGVTEAAKKLALSVTTHLRWERVARAGTLMSVDAHRLPALVGNRETTTSPYGPEMPPPMPFCAYNR